MSFVSLQVGDAPPPGVTATDWTADLTDFAATAALIASLDLVIAVDTAVAHLAGALARAVSATRRMWKAPSVERWPIETIVVFGSFAAIV